MPHLEGEKRGAVSNVGQEQMAAKVGEKPAEFSVTEARRRQFEQ